MAVTSRFPGTFRKSLFAGALVFPVFLALFSPASSSAEIDVDAIKNPLKADQAAVSKGKALYLEHCAVCHGSKADGKGPAADSFEVEPWGFTGEELEGVSDGFLFQQIKNGGAWYEMPPFALGLKDDDIWSVISYLRSLKK